MPNNEWGDFQTPSALADWVIERLPPDGWQRVLEPTCGTGSFLGAAKKLGDVERKGIEVQQSYADEARLTGAKVTVANIFEMNLGTEVAWSTEGPLLVLGNPPWVTNAQLGSLGSINLPPKSNFRGLRGFDALTGASNFDIAEFIWLKLILELQHDEPTIALLCKTQVARNVLQFCRNLSIPIKDSIIRKIDAKKWFNAAVDACLFTLTVGGPGDWSCPVYPNEQATSPASRIGFVDGRLIADTEAHARSAFADGISPFEWRQGVKHDAAGIMELVTAEGSGDILTRDGNPLDVEEEFLYPLLKCTDLHRARLDPTKRVIVTQRSLREDPTESLSQAPNLLRYLQDNAAVLDGRKSSIYRGRPRFSMFGIGDYTFSTWKVAVSGLHGSPQFQLIRPFNNKPVLLDDTCYFLPFEDESTAALTTVLLRSQTTTDLIAALAFPGAKRPITKKLLQRIDLGAIANRADKATIDDAACVLLGHPLEPDAFDRYPAVDEDKGQVDRLF